MSNQAYIETVKCQKTYQDKGASYIEVKVFDDYNSGSSEISSGCEVNLKDDLDILQYCKDYGSEESLGICDVIDSLLENTKGITINNTYYGWSEIKHIFLEE